MKKTLFFAAVAALFAFASCQKEVAPAQNQGEDPVFTATIASQTTKTTVDAATAKVAWVNEDEITVTDAASTSAKYKVSAINEGRATFTKVEGQPTLEAGPYTAVYGTDPSTSQSYSESAPSLPMSASSSTTSLEFEVTCGLLELSLTAGESVTSIEVTGTPTKGSETTYTLTCSTPVSIASGAKFFIALPAGSYTSFLINGQNGAICKKEKSGESVAIAANHITPISFKSLHFAVQLWEDGPYWATANIGADNSTDAGLYFAWGDVTGQTWNGSEWSDGGFFTTPTVELEGDKLKPAYDAATQKWGADWSMPTNTDFENLISSSYTSIEYVTDGIAGIRVTGTGDYSSNSIFLPFAGYGDGSILDSAGDIGYYWSSVQDDSPYAYYLHLLDPDIDDPSVSSYNKFSGCSVRPVRSYSAPTPSAPEYPEAPELACVKIGDVWWAPVNCGYDATHPYGLLYQWGRKVGSGYDSTEGMQEATEATYDTDGYNKNPDDNKFYLQVEDPCDWYANDESKQLTSWPMKSGDAGYVEGKIANPCPDGWRVPTYDELNALSGNKSGVSLGSAGWDSTNNGYWFNGTTSPSTGNGLFLPAAGFRDGGEGEADYRGSSGIYWSSSVQDESGWTLEFNDSDAFIGSYDRAGGYSVRCVQE